jgi:hypothetical protein
VSQSWNDPAFTDLPMCGRARADCRCTDGRFVSAWLPGRGVRTWLVEQGGDHGAEGGGQARAVAAFEQVQHWSAVQVAGEQDVAEDVGVEVRARLCEQIGDVAVAEVVPRVRVGWVALDGDGLIERRQQPLVAADDLDHRVEKRDRPRATAAPSRIPRPAMVVFAGLRVAYNATSPMARGREPQRDAN